MAKRAQRATRATDATSAGDTVGALQGEAPASQFLMFSLVGGQFGFSLDDVTEIVRVPRLSQMPLGPRSLLGLANLHGVVLPIVGLRRLLGLPEISIDDAMRVIVVDRGAPVGFLVDRIVNLAAVASDRLENDDAGAGGMDPDLLDGTIKGAEGVSTIKILNPERLLRSEFSQVGAAPQRASKGASISLGAMSATTTIPERLVSLVSFELGKQEYAFPLERVREIIQLPDHVSEVAWSETAVLGVVTLRDRLMPLVSLRALLGLPVEREQDEPGKVLVLPIGQGVVGVVADRTREILHVDPTTVDPAPPLLTRGEGDAVITSICRLDGGKRLVALLSPDHLFRSDLVRRVLSEQPRESTVSEGQTDGEAMADEQFVIFRLGEQEYGLPISAVDEIARLPEQIARLPKAPTFVDGVMNLRGTVVPVVDLRRRFEIDSKDLGSSQRILVVALSGAKTGFIVDSVSAVMRVMADAIRPAPEVSAEQMRVIGRVANLESDGRMIFLIDPAQLLDRLESEVLATFDRNQSAPASNIS
jgi:purine-binding chemotaxis protein CheW